MAKTARGVIGAGAAAVLVSTMVPIVSASAQESSQENYDSGFSISEACEREAGCLVCEEKVSGAFEFSQTAVASNEVIRNCLLSASRVLCGASSQSQGGIEESQSVGEIEVSGDVAHTFSASVEDMASENSASLIMGCTCGANPAGGLASINAPVRGVPFDSILKAAEPFSAVNTVVFTSIDGYEVALPLSYIKNRPTLIVYEVNGEPLDQSVGGSNQLWVGSTSANCYVRDIATISFEAREVEPAVPKIDTTEAAVTPNVNVQWAGLVE